MTIADFIKITHRISNDIQIQSYWKPDAVAMSRKIFNDLAQEAMMLIYARPDDDEITPDAKICGLEIFVDDDMPDEYYQIGYKERFIAHFKFKEKLKHMKEGI